MGLIKWLKRELDSSNSCKRRQSEPPLSGNSSQLPRDESYVKALSKFNEWRHRQIFGGSARLSRKQSRKKLERRGQSDTYFENRNVTNDNQIVSKNVTTPDNSLYEEIQVNRILQHHDSNESSSPLENSLDVIPVRHSYPTTEIGKNKPLRNSSFIQPNNLQIYENTLIELVSQFDQSPDILNISRNIFSPPVKFFKDNSNPFENVRTPIRDQELHSEEFTYQSPRDLQGLDVLRATFQPIEEEESNRDSTSRRSSRNPPYQTVINKHGEKVEYALPLNEKLDDDEVEYCVDELKESDCRVIALNSTSSYQQYVDENFQFLNEKERFGISHMSTSFGRNQFSRGNVPVTDLDKTNGTKITDDQNNFEERDIIQELEALELWSRNLSDNIGVDNIKKASNMYFAEVIVCKPNEVTEKNPRQIFETLNGTLHSGTFHCVPVTQFKAQRREQHYTDSVIQLNYEILRKIRHPDIALLMGITVDNKCALDSLILEPLDFSLSHLIHNEGICIPTSSCLMYALQINNAVTYLHKHGLVHSNISTHSIFMSHTSKAVKLTSFELTTSLNGDIKNELISIFQSGNQLLNSGANDLKYKLRPHNIEYRKKFSKHNYQAPELLSNQFPFVFPKIQCDVYGICLTLWEMINCIIPFPNFTYDDMLKLANHQNCELPKLQEERQKPFASVLRLGLNILAEKRISDTTELNDALSEISLNVNNDKINAPNSEEKFLSEKETSDVISNLLDPRQRGGPIIYERTSTIKKRKNDLGENRLTARQLFVYSQIEKLKDSPDMMYPSHTSSPNSPLYGFDIGDMSIPETPIARSNKLRKTAWLSNQSISPIVHLEINSKDTDTAINEIQIMKNKKGTEDTLTSNKLYNVNIRIKPNTKKIKNPVNNNESFDENASPEPQTTSQITDHIKFFNSVSKSNPEQHELITTPSPTQNPDNFNKNVTKPTPVAEKVLNEYPNPISQKSINEFFSRTQHSADFENSQWRREKQKCDQSVRSQRRISVKDAVNKFESFSKSVTVESISPKSKRTGSSASSRSDDKKKIVLHQQTDEDDVDQNLSKLNVVLTTKSNSDEVNTKSNNSKSTSECGPMLTLNFKKLDRRSSDLSAYFIRQTPKGKGLKARHSIYGTEIFKRLRKAEATNESENEDGKEGSKTAQNTNFLENKPNDFKIKVGKLTCLNCGHKLFVVDDIVRSITGEDNNDAFTEMLLTPLKRNGLQQSKSPEDFYIDDDFCEDFELCANMELGTRSHLSDLMDFDIFSADIFNPADESANEFA